VAADQAVQVSGRLVIAIYGKAVRGAREAAGKAPHLVAALAHGIGAVLGQAAVDAKPNEIPAVRELLKAFADLAGAVITIDALHTQDDTAQAITGRGEDYVMTVKGNMPTLYRQLKKLPWAGIPRLLGREHRPRPPGPPHHQGRPGAGLDRVHRRRPGRRGPPHGHEEGQEDRRGRLPHHQRPWRRSRRPGGLDPWAPGDREQAHWVRDVIYQEDKSLVRTGNAPRVMASLRSLTISLLRLDGHANIAAANRHHARDPQRTLRLLQTS
jgi:predicted transposase YbfD/YdcC